MFSGLFDEDAAQFDTKESGRSGFGLPRPAAPRNSTNLCGLSNLGATCYLNSLLQTLHFTPEFREALFTLGEDELGVYSEGEGADNSMVRVIPIQLQKLFVRLLLLNQQSAEVDSLTTSFGWKNNEELQQHDVQELNRILFSAVEASLLGTTGEPLIARLYHGTSVQHVTCQQCGRVSEREEDFLDFPVALSNRSGLEQALGEMFLQTELLEGANQYHCESCHKLVDARRGCHLRKLPPILTFALLRFLYDFQKGERYKDTSRFRFPLELDMAPYCEPHPLQGIPDQSHPPGDMHYELFSVVVHGGSTHSGHYTAYIRDIDDLGAWTHPDKEPIQLQADPTSGNVDFIDFESPTELLQELLRQLGGTTRIDKLCKAMSDKTGVSWNKRFKKQFGAINKFLKTCTEFFVVNEVNCVSLKGSSGNADTISSCEKEQEPRAVKPEASAAQPATTGSTAAESGSCGTGEEMTTSRDVSDEGASVEQPQLGSGSAGSSTDLDFSELPGGGAVEDESSGTSKILGVVSESDSELVLGAVPGVRAAEDLSCDSESTDGPAAKEGSGAQAKKRKKDLNSPPPPGHRWFEFNDTHVGPILVKSIEKMFQGKQSAYMLFYRKKAAQRPNEARGNPLYCTPERLQMEVAAANAILEEERVQYDIAVNTVKLNIHLSAEYAFANGALQRIEDSPPAVVSIDRRKTIVEMKFAIIEVLPELAGEPMILHTAKYLPAGLHLYNCVSGDDCSTVADTGIANDSHLFLWDGEEVGGEAIQVGASCEPILLNVTYPTTEDKEIEMVLGFCKNSTLGELRVVLADLQGCRPQQVTVSQVKVSETRAGQSHVVILSGSKDKYTLEELNLSDGDRLAAEREVKKGVKTLAHSVADKQNKMISFIVEDRCSLLHEELSLFPMEVSKDELLSTVKIIILSRIGIAEVEGGGRLRLEDDTAGIGPPLHENQTVTQAGITSGQTVIVEPGPAPLSSQLALRCTLQPLKADSVMYEVILEQSTTVQECLAKMVETAGLQGNQWHLRRTNWCKEAAEVLEDEMATLEQERLKAGDLLLIEEGQLPPKGFIRLPIFLYIPAAPLLTTPTATPPGSEGAGALAWITESIKTALIGNSSEESDSKAQEVNSQPMEERPEKEGVACGTRVTEQRELPSTLYPPLPGQLSELGCVEVNKDATTEDLKTLVMTLPILEDTFLPTPAFLRVRELVNGRPGKILKQPHQTLRRQKLASASQVCCTVLQHEENLPTSALVFNICMRIPGERRYGPLTEIIYDTAPSTSPQALLSHIGELLGLPLKRLAIAKHKLESFQWIRIQDSYQTGKKKKKGKAGALNIKNSPIMLRDGDTVGVKDLQYDPDDQDDFSTPQDDKGREILEALQEEKRKRRRAKGKEDVFSGEAGKQRQRRAELGIKIFVPDYQAKLNSE